MITCNFCSETEFVYTEGDHFHLCKKHDDERRREAYEEYKKSYSSDPRGHLPIRGLFPCKLCKEYNNCLCEHCPEHCLKRLDDLKDKNLFLFSATEKKQ